MLPLLTAFEPPLPPYRWYYTGSLEEGDRCPLFDALRCFVGGEEARDDAALAITWVARIIYRTTRV